MHDYKYDRYERRSPDLMKQFRTATVEDHRRLMAAIMANKLNEKRLPLILKKRGGSIMRIVKPATIKKVDEVLKSVERQIAEKFAEGQILKWKSGPFKGRECVVKDFHYELKPYHKDGIKVWIWAYTTKLDRSGPMASHDSFHRCGHSPEEFEVA